MVSLNVCRKSSVSKTLLLLVFLFFANKAGVESCAFYYDWPDTLDTLSLIEPSIVQESLFNGEYLFFSENYGIYPDPHSSDWSWSQWTQSRQADDDVDSANIDECVAYLKARGLKKVNRDLLRQFIYSGDESSASSKSRSSNDQNAIKEEVQQKMAWAKELMGGKAGGKNPFSAFAAQKDLVEYVNFLNGSNETLDRSMEEPGHYDYKAQKWVAEENTAKKEVLTPLKLAEQRAFSKDTDDFFRVKYAFKAMQIDAALEQYPDILHLYDQVVGPSKVHGLTRYRCEGYKAMALCAMNDKAKAFPLYVDLFDQCPTLRYTARFSVQIAYKPEEAESLAAQVPGPHRKAAAYFLAGAAQPRAYSAKLIEGMVKEAPQEEQTEAMMVRLVQALEKANMNQDRMALIGAGGKAGTQYDDLVALCDQAAAAPKVKRSAFWFGVASYLSLLEGNTTQAEVQLQKAKSCPNKNKVLAHQLQVWGTLLAFAQNSKAVESGTQKGLIEDLNWAKTLKDPGNNKGLYHSLLVLAGDKYLSLMDLPRSILCFEAARGPYSVWGPTAYGRPTGGTDDRNIYNISYSTSDYLIDAIATEPELVKLGDLLGGQKDGPLDGWLEGKAQLNVQDVLLIRAVRKMRGGDYHAAQNLLNQIPAGYFAKPPKPQKDQYGEEAPIYYVQSKCITYKLFPRRDEIEFIAPKGKEFHLDIQAYCKWMMNQTDQVEAARKNNSPKLSKLLYRLANAYASSWATGWPEVKMDHYSGPVHTYYSETKDRFPLGIPTVADQMKARFEDFENSTPNLHAKAVEIYEEIVKLGKNRELAAKSLVSENWVLMDGKLFMLGPKEDNRVMSNLRRLKKGYTNTAFYADYEPRCEVLQQLKDEDEKGKGKNKQTWAW